MVVIINSSIFMLGILSTNLNDQSTNLVEIMLIQL